MQNLIAAFLQTMHRLHAEPRGSVAVLTAMMAVPLILLAGIATDYSRESLMKAAVQTVADNAALAGASALGAGKTQAVAISLATAYFKTAIAGVSQSATVTAPTVTSPNSITVTVTATATLGTSLMALVASSMQVGVLATAQAPGSILNIPPATPFKSDAGDGDSVYMYKVPSTGGYPAPFSTTSSNYTLLYTNNPAIDPNYTTDNAASKTIALGPNDQVGFALYNQTHAINGKTQVNAQGAGLGSTHTFFSSLPSVTGDATYGYPTQEPTYYTLGPSTSCGVRVPITPLTTTATFIENTATDPNPCTAHPCTVVSGGKVYQNALLVNGACSTTTTGAQTCSQLSTSQATFRWNDMGGVTSDDYDYNDAVYTIGCTPNMSAAAAANNTVVLVQ